MLKKTQLFRSNFELKALLQSVESRRTEPTPNCIDAYVRKEWNFDQKTKRRIEMTHWHECICQALYWTHQLTRFFSVNNTEECFDITMAITVCCSFLSILHQVCDFCRLNIENRFLSVKNRLKSYQIDINRSNTKKLTLIIRKWCVIDRMIASLSSVKLNDMKKQKENMNKLKIGEQTVFARFGLLRLCHVGFGRFMW